MNRALLVCCAMVFAVTLPAVAAIPPRLKIPPQATLAVIAPIVQAYHRPHYDASCFPMQFAPMKQLGAWVAVGANCRVNQDATFVDYLHWTGTKWVVACGHGDDVMSVDDAVKLCGMTQAIALAFAHPWHNQMWL
jgi:hypothetical protein